MAIQEIGLVIATGILVFITGWYAFETRRIVGRVDKECEELNRPILAFTLISWQPKIVKLS